MENKSNWSDTKGKIKTKFGKLSDQDIKDLEGNMGKLQGKLEKAYGYNTDKAKTESEAFKSTLKSKAV